MTVIAAVALADRVIMGSDTAAGCGGTTVYRADGKVGVFDARGERILIGAAGSGAIVPMLLRNLVIEDVPRGDVTDEAADEWANAVAEAITGVLAEATPPLVCSAGNVPELDGVLLLAWKQYAWFVATHSAFRPQDGIVAIGSGREIALGSLHTNTPTDPLHVEEVMRYAIQLATRFDSECGVDERGPIVHSTKAD